ncbi:isopropylmalate isomerase [Marinobacter salinisoli]|uniref:Isopropylmalate isomerase n=2 Tax=Marinobacter salinisoli TaxID=2769486 RepID=A0ABX7MWG5_9GAMM|nr:isopropylmalate isomerase [Marinobacter salinisoli]
MLGLAFALTACGSLPTETIDGDNRQAFIARLAAEPAVCRSYREVYVTGFRANVRALAKDDPDAAASAKATLDESRNLLLRKGLSGSDCARPYCIIEPLQNGQLDSWCGFRIDADEGEELYQWLSYPEVREQLSSHN